MHDEQSEDEDECEEGLQSRDDEADQDDDRPRGAHEFDQKRAPGQVLGPFATGAPEEPPAHDSAARCQERDGGQHGGHDGGQRDREDHAGGDDGRVDGDRGFPQVPEPEVHECRLGGREAEPLAEALDGGGGHQCAAGHRNQADYGRHEVQSRLRADGLQRVRQPQKETLYLHQLAEGERAEDDADETPGREARDCLQHQGGRLQQRQDEQRQDQATHEYREPGRELEPEEYQDSGDGEQQCDGRTHGRSPTFLVTPERRPEPEGSACIAALSIADTCELREGNNRAIIVD